MSPAVAVSTWGQTEQLFRQLFAGATFAAS
jgi:hypothetical protein